MVSGDVKKYRELKTKLACMWSESSLSAHQLKNGGLYLNRPIYGN